MLLNNHLNSHYSFPAVRCSSSSCAKQILAQPFACFPICYNSSASYRLCIAEGRGYLCRSIKQCCMRLHKVWMGRDLQAELTSKINWVAQLLLVSWEYTQGWSWYYLSRQSHPRLSWTPSADFLPRVQTKCSLLQFVVAGLSVSPLRRV